MRPRIILAVAVALLASAVAVAMANDADNRGRGTTLSFYASATDLAGQPGLGEWASVAWDLHELGGTADAPIAEGEPVGRMAGTCTPLTVTDEGVEGVCLGWIELDGRGLLTLMIRTGSDSFAITGGTGDFAGAEGIGHEPAVDGTANDRVVTLELAGFNQP